MQSTEIRTRFLDFFAHRGHRVVRSSSLVPANDPTLLFTNAGMNQFKDVFLGCEKRDYVRACSSQKCVRAGGKHNDLEQVGRTTRHHTFFEMLGNFSFGDYFKKQAIEFAWELVTAEFQIPRDKLYVTVFREDDEAAKIWKNYVWHDRIKFLDEKDNFWAMGETGPCGPCSEIHYDLGAAASEQGHKDCKFPCDCGRYVELWNLVFMQFNRVCDEWGEDPEMPGVPRCVRYHDDPLPKPSVDTGAGLERLATVLQGKLSNFDTDLFRPLIERISEGVGRSYGEHSGIDISFRVIADHSRAATFLVADGVIPSNDGRGYVLRKIIRRALRHNRILGVKDAFLFRIAGRVAECMRVAYPELGESISRISSTIKHEEERYDTTVALAMKMVNEELKKACSAMLETTKASGQRPPEVVLAERADGTLQVAGTEADSIRVVLPGEAAFRLYDTYGLSLDLLEDEGLMRGFKVDRKGYEAEMQRQRERARASWKGAAKKTALPVYQELAEKQKTAFDGYAQTLSADCRIVVLVAPGKAVNEAKPGDLIEIVLDHTPFYAEAGGQVGDVGHFFAPGTTHEVAHINDTYTPVSGLIAHKAVAKDTIRAGDTVTAQIDAERREAIRRNHTATHLLHAALRHTLGTHVKQAGSLVAPDRLRFDFTHYAGLDEQALVDIEDLVNEHVLSNDLVETQTTDLDAAIASGAMALFGEKYGDKVRVVSVADGSFSKELCGGTHVIRTGDIGLFKIVSETSVAAGTRRIEAVTGQGVVDYLRRATETLAEVTQVLRAKPGEVVQAAEKLMESEKKLRKQLESQQLKRAAGEAQDLVAGAKEVKGVRVVSARVEVTDRAAMRQMVDGLRGKIGSGVIVLGSASDGKVALIAAVTKDLTDRLDAGKIVKEAAALIDGTGGGRKDLAEAGGKNPEKLQESLDSVPSIVERFL